MYKTVVKRVIDILLSGMAIIFFALPLVLIAMCIKIDDPGPVLFKQKRVGRSKNGQTTYFQIWKFRSMKMVTPRDTPTHLLEKPEQWITKTGGFLRKTSLDELPQIFNIFVGHMSVVGPRPALWNQYDLIEARDRYGANAVRPGLTGWAQINGRDELEIPVKAKLDGDYVAMLNAGFWKGVAMDLKCFFGTFLNILQSKGVVEGGTGAMKKEVAEDSKSEVTIQ